MHFRPVVLLFPHSSHGVNLPTSGNDPQPNKSQCVGPTPVEILRTFGESFASSRSVTIFAITLPVIGLLERNGLQQQARTLIGKLGTNLTTGRFLTLYLLLRQLTAAVGLQTIAGPAQSVRPMIAPMAEAATERRNGGRPLPEKVREKVRSHSAGTDTVGLFFGEDCFLAIGSILLITGLVNSTYDTHLEPLHLALWAIPSAACAFLIHGGRLLRLDRALERELVTANAQLAVERADAQDGRSEGDGAAK
ncbi:DUF969 domain-containing protein [Streptomyces sp. AA1529]|uniref:DUF969 domain-containing protein n=1 Tax=Streptomyces sp. AA1529 TaxID=1203257 RepID=UPI003D727892